MAAAAERNEEVASQYQCSRQIENPTLAAFFALVWDLVLGLKTGPAKGRQAFFLNFSAF
jgi:hypothetical protein